MNQKNNITRAVLEFAGLPVTDERVKKTLPAWWANTRTKDQGGLRLTDQGFDCLIKAGVKSYKIEFENPVGHPSRRDEAKPILVDKLSQRLKQRYTTAKQKKILKLGLDHQQFMLTPVPHWMNLLATRKPIFKAGA